MAIPQRLINSDGDWDYESLTRVALFLESRKELIDFPSSQSSGTQEIIEWITTAIRYGGKVQAEELGRFLYYLADVLEDTGRRTSHTNG